MTTRSPGARGWCSPPRRSLLVAAGPIAALAQQPQQLEAAQAEPPARAGQDTDDHPPHPLHEIDDAMVRLPLAALLGAALALRPRRRGTPRRSPAVIQTQIMLSVVGAVIMLVVGASLARAFGIVGAASLIRYRSKIDDPKDAVVMLCALAVGLASGVGLYALSVFSTVFLVGGALGDRVVRAEGVKRFELKVKAGKETDSNAAADRGDPAPLPPGLRDPDLVGRGGLLRCPGSDRAQDRPGLQCASSSSIPTATPRSSGSTRRRKTKDAVTHVELIIQPDDGLAPLLQAVRHAKNNIDIVIFRFDRTELEKALEAAVARGVVVRALIAHTNRGGEKSLRKLELRMLAAGVTVARTADDLLRYHGKMMIVDGELYVLGFNFTKLDMEKSRSFGDRHQGPEAGQGSDRAVRGGQHPPAVHAVATIASWSARRRRARSSRSSSRGRRSSC